MEHHKNDRSSAEVAQQASDVPRPPSESRMINEVSGDLFNAPEGSALIHACNTLGVWGGGVAQSFKILYPAAFRVYREHCLQYRQFKETHAIADLSDKAKGLSTVVLPVGTALIIPPQPSDSHQGKKKKKQHWVICLFTSEGIGRYVDPPAQILNNTFAALQDLKSKLTDLLLDGTEPSPRALYSCRFNSGLFAVPWIHTRQLLEESGLRITVVTPPTRGE
ncbi:ADP-ribose 1''-phosphate phosphatase [Penicillium diatomitis]|uniref:ADP-ribose 1''-phosphate phosphatase n=1 Tax=Penicillium diatomitis TaxID=2819901 RepID=A0A9W9XEH9_9EURO|nr:ADP-ribose 1''-phosphate phosphatase [Penicillium diatomitis]KAJ5490785.1 ADP-ribose 1''-phosphate phosphatase [Penicillium diatomitis]